MRTSCTAFSQARSITRAIWTERISLGLLMIFSVSGRSSVAIRQLMPSFSKPSARKEVKKSWYPRKLTMSTLCANFGDSDSVTSPSDRAAGRKVPSGIRRTPGL